MRSNEESEDQKREEREERKEERKKSASRKEEEVSANQAVADEHLKLDYLEEAVVRRLSLRLCDVGILWKRSFQSESDVVQLEYNASQLVSERVAPPDRVLLLTVLLVEEECTEAVVHARTVVNVASNPHGAKVVLAEELSQLSADPNSG